MISIHLKNIFKKVELEETATVAKNATVQTESGRTVTREENKPPPLSNKALAEENYL